MTNLELLNALAHDAKLVLSFTTPYTLFEDYYNHAPPVRPGLVIHLDAQIILWIKVE